MSTFSVSLTTSLKFRPSFLSTYNEHWCFYTYLIQTPYTALTNMWYNFFLQIALFALIAVALAAPKPEPAPQAVFYSSPLVSPYSAYSGPLVAPAALPYSAYSAYPSAYPGAYLEYLKKWFTKMTPLKVWY